MVFPWHEFNSSSFPNGKSKDKCLALLAVEGAGLGKLNCCLFEKSFSPWIGVFKKMK